MFKLNFLILLIFLFAVVHFSNCQLHDDTRNSGTQGKDVVDATVRILRRSAIFPADQGFLRRLALVESAFGNDSSTYRPGYNGGVWQVDEIAFLATKNNSLLQTYYDKIETVLGLKWDEVSWQDLRKPLYSAIAARLFIIQTSERIPGTIALQALFWARVYRSTGDSQRYEEEVRDDERDQTCTGTADICMVMDGSGSIGFDSFQVAKQAAKDFSESFKLDPVTGTRIGFLVYESIVLPRFDLNNVLTQAQMSANIMDTTYPGGGTATGDGIMGGLQYFNDAIPRADGVAKVMLTFTDGQSNAGSTSVPAAAAAIQAAGILSIAVGIGNAVLDELRIIAGGIEENVIPVDDYAAFAELIAQMNGDVCRMPQTPPIGTNSTGVVEMNERRYYEILQQPDGITVKVYTKMTGRFTGWYSYSEPNPNTAIYDGLLTDDATYIPTVSGRLARDGEQRVYITIQGTTADEVTEYNLLIEEGDTVPVQITTATELSTTSTDTITTEELTPSTTDSPSTTVADTSTPGPTTQATSISTGSQTSESETVTATTELPTTTPRNPSVTIPNKSSQSRGSLILTFTAYFFILQCSLRF